MSGPMEFRAPSLRFNESATWGIPRSLDGLGANVLGGAGEVNADVIVVRDISTLARPVTSSADVGLSWTLLASTRSYRV